MRHKAKTRLFMACAFALAMLASGLQSSVVAQSSYSANNTEVRTTPTGYVDLGLPSGTLWKSRNEAGFYNYSEAMQQFGRRLPTDKHWEELEAYCKWVWYGSGYTVVGPNGNSITLPATGDYPCDGDGNQGALENVGTYGTYYSSKAEGDFEAWTFSINKTGYHSGGYGNCGQYGRHSVRLVY